MLPSFHELISAYLALQICKPKPEPKPKPKSINLNCSEKETLEAIKKVTRK